MTILDYYNASGNERTVMSKADDVLSGGENMARQMVAGPALTGLTLRE
jgi:hypothetical protein